MADHTAHNSKVFNLKLRQFADSIELKIADMLKGVAQTIVGVIDGNFAPPKGTEQFPIWSNNLHDATGIGVYVNGRLHSFIPTARATQPQSDKGQTGIFGSALLQQALHNGSTQFAKGVWIVLFSTVPYAYKINTQGSKRGRGVGFFEALGQTLLYDVIAGLQPIAA